MMSIMMMTIMMMIMMALMMMMMMITMTMEKNTLSSKYFHIKSKTSISLKTGPWSFLDCHISHSLDCMNNLLYSTGRIYCVYIHDPSDTLNYFVSFLLYFLCVCVCVWGQLWYSCSPREGWSTGRAIDPAKGA